MKKDLRGEKTRLSWTVGPAAQNVWGLNFQWQALSFAQILNVYQVLGP